jgi:adenylylsulfate kinase
MFTPEDDVSREIEEFIQNHPVSVAMRSKPQYSESRPHLKIPKSQRSHNLTGGTLTGPGRVVVPPFVWSESGGKSLVSISYLGTDLCGHPGIVHGGLLATLLDEGLARCCFAALPNKVGMTANLNINYRNPTPAGAFVVLRAKTVEGHIETLVGEGEKPVVLVEASALFIEPRQAAVSGYLLTPGRYLREANIVLDNGKSLSGSINEARKWTSVSESKVQSQEFF